MRIKNLVSLFVLLILLTPALQSCGMALRIDCSYHTLTVNTMDDTDDMFCRTSRCSLRDAISTSNACPGTQTVSIPAGTYTLTHTGTGEDHNSTGDLDITASVTIVGEGNPIINGNHSDRIFDVMPSTTVDITGLTLTNGTADGGGAIRNQGNLTLHNMNIHDNQTTSDVHAPGGGILSTGGTLTIEDSQVLNNSAAYGGGLAVAHYPDTTNRAPLTLTINGATISGNTASASDGYGGGLFLQYTATLAGSDIGPNNVAQGGAGISNSGNLTLLSDTVHDNQARSEGGGIANAGDLRMESTVVRNNTAAERGGGISNSHNADIKFSAIVNNTQLASALSTRGGGGIYTDTVGGTTMMSIVDSTISGNNAHAAFGGGIANLGSLEVIYATIAGNVDGGLDSVDGANTSVQASVLADNGRNCDLPVTSNGFNIDSGVNCGFDQASDLNSTDPLLNPLSASGDTFIQTFDTDAPSPALDSIDETASVCADLGHRVGDQLGTGRPQGPGCDRGAWEAPTASASVPIVIASPTATATAVLNEKLLLTFTENAFCRKGPGTAYEDVITFNKGQQAQIDGQNDFSPRWYWVRIPNSTDHCWVSYIAGQPSGPIDAVPVQAAPATPTPQVKSGGTCKLSVKACAPKKFNPANCTCY